MPPFKKTAERLKTRKERLISIDVDNQEISKISMAIMMEKVPQTICLFFHIISF